MTTADVALIIFGVALGGLLRGRMMRVRERQFDIEKAKANACLDHAMRLYAETQVVGKMVVEVFALKKYGADDEADDLLKEIGKRVVPAA